MQDIPPELVEEIVRSVQDSGGSGNAPMWGILVFIALRWLWQEKTNRDGPGFLKNGTMEHITDRIGDKVGKKVADELGTRLVGPLARQAHAIEEVAREMLDSRLCPMRSADVENLIRKEREKAEKLEKLKAEKMNPHDEGVEL